MAQSFNFTFLYIDDVLSLSNPKFGDYVHLIYPSELEIKDTTESFHSTSYIPWNVHEYKPMYKLYDKRDDFDF